LVVRFRLLGPVEVLAGDRVVRMGALKQRHLLAALLFDGGGPATFDTLIDRLWDDDPPADARGTLYGYVARLRRTLKLASPAPAPGEGASLERWPGGYQLLVPPDAVDLFVFRSLVERARSTDRRALLDEALGLWRGEALGGLPGEWAARAREGLERQRQAAFADWAGATLEAGDHAAVIDRLTAAPAPDSLAEPLIAVQLRALHAAGRTPEALDLFARSRDRIAAELPNRPCGWCCRRTWPTSPDRTPRCGRPARG
jgi:DNA-binding SARP family transcriptional activator